MLTKLFRGAVVVAVVLLPFEALGQEGLQCMREVLEAHAATQALLASKEAKVEGYQPRSGCRPDGRFINCTYADFRLTPKMPGQLSASYYQLTECFKNHAKATSKDVLGGDRYDLPRESCSIGAPNSGLGEQWSFIATCSQR
jgi:hypothetical protein